MRGKYSTGGESDKLNRRDLPPESMSCDSFIHTGILHGAPIWVHTQLSNLIGANFKSAVPGLTGHWPVWHPSGTNPTERFTLHSHCGNSGS